jgi:hypothetical protein
MSTYVSCAVSAEVSWVKSSRNLIHSPLAYSWESTAEVEFSQWQQWNWSDGVSQVSRDCLQLRQGDILGTQRKRNVPGLKPRSGHRETTGDDVAMGISFYVRVIRKIYSRVPYIWGSNKSDYQYKDMVSHTFERVGIRVGTRSVSAQPLSSSRMGCSYSSLIA